MKKILVSLVLLLLAVPSFALSPPPAESNGGRAVTVPTKTLRLGYGEPSIATDGESFFTAWTDSRYGSTDVYGTRLDGQGRALDLDALPVVTTWRSDYRPVVMSNGSEYAILNSSEYLGTFRVRATRDGHLIGAGEPLMMRGGPVAGVWNGSLYVVAWVSFEAIDKNSLKLICFDSELRVVKEILVAEPLGQVSTASIAAGGSNVMVTWETALNSGHTVNARLFESGGTPISEELRLSTATIGEPPGLYEQHSPVVSWNGSAYVVVWTHQTLRGAVLSPAGSVVMTLTFAPPASPRSVSISWDGFAHLVTWNEPEYYGRAALLTSTGDVLDVFNLGTREIGRAAIASNGRAFIVIRGSEVLRLRSTGSPRFDTLPPITRAYVYQEKPAIAAGSNGLLVAWFERGTVYATRLNRFGAPIDEMPIEVGKSFYDFNPQISVAAAGDVYLIAWTAATIDLRFARVTATGQVLDQGGVKLADRSGVPLVASNGNEFLILWGGHLAYNQSFISAATVGPSGAAVIHDSVISGFFPHVPVQLVWTGSDYALGWLEYQTPPCSSRNCNVRIATHVTHFTRDAAVSSSTTVLSHGGLKGLQWSGSELVMIYNETDGFLYSRRLSGTPQRIGARADGPTFFTRSSTGFSVFATRYGVPPYPWSSVSVISLDPTGAPHGTELEWISEDRPSITDATFGFDRTWATFTTFWKPLPEAHDGAIARAFFRSFSERRRNIGLH